MAGNELFQRKMAEKGLTQVELAEALNDWLQAHGHEGTVSDRVVRYWLTGKTRRPWERTRLALQAVFGCSLEELGFVPPARTSPSRPSEQPVNRRSFLSVTTATASSPLMGTAPSSVGFTEVMVIRRKLDALNALDQTQGGHDGLERAALDTAAEALSFQQRAASQRMRRRLFSLAADLTATAAWTALDARQFVRARKHLDQALSLAGLGQDSVTELRVWKTLAMLGFNTHQYTDSLAAAQAAQRTGVARRDPMYAAIGHTQAAVGHAALGDRQSTLRSLGYAEESLAKVTVDERPTWVAFFGPGELYSVVASTQQHLSRPAEAEAASYRALTALPEQFRRNRASVTARLAISLVHQGEIEQGCAKAEEVFQLMDGHPLPGRLRSLIGDFYRDLLTMAPDTNAAHEWGDRFRTEWI
ncbi:MULTISPECIES: XRE family transcriptional regulator [unclassified Streptomyces]|uniref:XRE family transcriptional regulator n=1 Tax=unclassified Streptomyces TaxID=2593676 RepID=UPI002E2BE779|nr:XRE family transcriptional regulator [Streptomyces sp. NBC_00223]